jgi:hypothetical protein
MGAAVKAVLWFVVFPYDLIGEGYVHRLILNQHEDEEDGVGSPNHRQESLHDRGTTRDGPSLKIVEINRPTGTAGKEKHEYDEHLQPLTPCCYFLLLSRT